MPASAHASRTVADSERDPLPVVLLRRGNVTVRDIEPLYNDRRIELIVMDRLSAEATSLARRVAGAVVATNEDPLNALVYAVSGGLQHPIVMLHSARYRTKCKDLRATGASDCFQMPLSPKALDRIVDTFGASSALARVDGALRLILDPIALAVRHGDKSTRLTQREFAVLQFLSSYHGRPVAAEKIIEYVWSNLVGGKRPRQILDVYVFQLRRKLERVGLDDAITTVRGIGYCLRRRS
jgi:hypothetical protein